MLLPVFGAFFGLISFLLSRLGWSRLAKQYAVAAVPATVDRTLLAYVRIGPVNYRNAVRAGITPPGVWRAMQQAAEIVFWLPERGRDAILRVSALNDQNRAALTTLGLTQNPPGAISRSVSPC
ncbi:hypothetical protein [Hymenobacter fastidiosus]|uniref:hypothetical protein n=1 Tax=Hymenobacter fastidiosus TaxID=486264 RepID=UPI0031E86667